MKVQIAAVCAFNTSPCVPPTRLDVEIMWTFCRRTRRRFECTHGNVLNLQTSVFQRATPHTTHTLLPHTAHHTLHTPHPSHHYALQAAHHTLHNCTHIAHTPHTHITYCTTHPHAIHHATPTPNWRRETNFIPNCSLKPTPNRAQELHCLLIAVRWRI